MDCMTSLDNTKNSDCSTAGKGFARSEANDIVSENCLLPNGSGKGYAKTSNHLESAVEPNCSTAGKGFARTENNEIVAEDCPLPHGPGKGFAKTDPGS